SSSQGAPVAGSRTPPHRSTTFSPRRYTAQAAPSSFPRRKFSSNTSRTGSKPGATLPFTSIVMVPSVGPAAYTGSVRERAVFLYNTRTDAFVGAVAPRAARRGRGTGARREEVG